MLFLIALSTILILSSIYVVRGLTKNLNHWEKKGVKYVKPVPLLGNMLPIVTKSVSTADLIKKLYNAFPDERYFGIFQFSTPVLLIRDFDLIKTITIKNFENFVDHTGFIPAEADPLWSKNLFASRGERWRDLRQTLSPAFTGSKMRTMFVLMEECAREFVSYFTKQNKDLIEVELKDICSRFTNDMIATTAFGIKCDSLKHKDNQFLLAGKELADFSGFKRLVFIMYGNFPSLCKWLNLKLINAKVGNFFKSIINETIISREQNNIIRPDLIHLLMLARKGKLKYDDYTSLPEAGFAAVQESEMGKRGNTLSFMTNEDITAQALIFFLGGFDTVSALMCFAGYELAVNPDVQKKLKAEILGAWEKTQGKITYESLLALKYLDMVISETLRKWPQGLWSDRKCTKSFTIEPEKEGEVAVKINVGDVIWVPIYGIHRDEKYYPNPEKFDPERFNDEDKEKIQSGMYLPFGIGPRNCIGSRFALLETKILFFYWLRDFDFVPVKNTQIPLKIDKNHAFLTAQDGFYVGLKRTKNVIIDSV